MTTVSPALLLLTAAATIASVSLATASVASADDKSACVASYERSQTLRKEHHLRKAREELKSCSRNVCPVLVRGDCVAWLDEVEGALPSVAIRASKDGADVASVRVVEDGEVVATKLDGTPLEVEPGEHAFRFETDGAPPIALTLVIREHEKDRVVPVVFASPHGEGAAAGEGAPSGEGTTTSRPVPIGVWVLGGVGVAGLATFGVLGGVGKSKESSLRSTCSPSCSSSSIDTVRGEYLGADVAVAIGAASLVSAAVWYLLRPTRRESGEPPAASVLQVGMAPRAGGGVLQWNGSF
jgi:hypothetical protein